MICRVEMVRALWEKDQEPEEAWATAKKTKIRGWLIAKEEAEISSRVKEQVKGECNGFEK